MGWEYSYNYGSVESAIEAGTTIAIVALIVAWVVALAISALLIIAMWKMFKKAGEEGWAAIVPCYNYYVLYKISWGNGWLFLLNLVAIIPFVGWIAALVINIMMYIKLAHSFGKGGGFACGLILLSPVFMLILGLSKDIEYIGPDGIAPESSGGYGGFPGGYAPPSQYQQESAANDQYHYQRNEPQAPAGGGFPGGYAPPAQYQRNEPQAPASGGFPGGYAPPAQYQRNEPQAPAGGGFPGGYAPPAQYQSNEPQAPAGGGFPGGYAPPAQYQSNEPQAPAGGGFPGGYAPPAQYQSNEPQAPAGGDYCPQCGEKLEPGTKFCPQCGKKL